MDYEKFVPTPLRRHFVAAYKGVFGYWFEFDGSVRFDDTSQGGALPFAYGKTVDDCRRMMENYEILTKERNDNEQNKRTTQSRRRADRVHGQPRGKSVDGTRGRGRRSRDSE